MVQGAKTSHSGNDAWVEVCEYGDNMLHFLLCGRYCFKHATIFRSVFVRIFLVDQGGGEAETSAWLKTNQESIGQPAIPGGR